MNFLQKHGLEIAFLLMIGALIVSTLPTNKQESTIDKTFERHTEFFESEPCDTVEMPKFTFDCYTPITQERKSHWALKQKQ